MTRLIYPLSLLIGGS